MKLISLNTWGGKYFEPLIQFIKSHAEDTDIFCFQEVYNTKSNIKDYRNIRANLLGELIKILPNFQLYYSIEISNFDANADQVDFDLTVGKSTFIKSNIRVESYEEFLLHGNLSEKNLKKDFSNLPITLQCLCLTGNKLTFICNVHGIAFPGSKLDTEIRIEHSKKIKAFLNTKVGAKIIAGDFNLLPDTQSIKILEDSMRNLVKEFNIEKTRSKLSPFYGKGDFQKFADYTFVTDIKVKNFQVPDISISDHLPMILEFE